MPLRKCSLCGNTNTRVYIHSKADLYSSNGNSDEFNCTSLGLSNPGEIRICSECGYIFTIPLYTEAEVNEKYAQVEDALHLQEKAARTKTYESSFQLLEKYRTSPGKLLDVGSYVGFFLEVATSRGWDVYGLEPSRWASRYAKDELKIDRILNQNLTSAAYAGEKFDVITMWDVIEHLFFPTEKFVILNRLLKDEGFLVFSTHDIKSKAARFLGRRYPFLMSMHVSHFNLDSLKFLLIKAGFKLLEIQVHVRYVSAFYLINRLSRYLPHLAKSLITLLPGDFLRRQLVPIKFMGLINVVAQKVNDV